MSICSNATAQDLFDLRKLTEKQKEQRALKIKKKFLEKTLDIKLTESLSPITKKLDNIKESTQKLADFFKK